MSPFVRFRLQVLTQEDFPGETPPDYGFPLFCFVPDPPSNETTREDLRKTALIVSAAYEFSDRWDPDRLA